jgi:hypothetical protein
MCAISTKERLVSLETMSFILGGILVAASLFGGGLEIKELKLPQIGSVARGLSAVVGVAFVVLAIYLNQKGSQFSNKPANVGALNKTVSFQAPMHGDLRLDVCQQWAQNCGESTATAWCKTKGFSRATEFPQENVGIAGTATRLIGTNQVCREQMCSSFVYITCEK